MDQEYITKLDTLPAHMRGAMQRWIEHGLNPGSFLSAVLCNDLMGAIGRADHVNRDALRFYVVYLYNYALSMCFGGPEQFATWKGLLAEQEVA